MSKNTITNYFSQLAQKRKREAPEHNSDDDFEEPKKPAEKPKTEKEPPKKKLKQEEDPQPEKKKKKTPSMKKSKTDKEEAAPREPSRAKDQEDPPWPDLPPKIKTPPKQQPASKKAASEETQKKPSPSKKTNRESREKDRTAEEEDSPDTEPDESLAALARKKKRTQLTLKEEVKEEEPPWDPPAVSKSKSPAKKSPQKKPAAKKKGMVPNDTSSSVEDIEEVDAELAAKATSTPARKGAGSKQGTPKEAQSAAKPRPRGNYGGGGGMWGGPRPDPPNLGMKEIPKGEPNCLYGKTFLFTGIGDSLQRDDAFALVEHYGGKIVKSVAKSCTHAVVGTDAGAKKLQQIEDRKDIKKLTEDELFELIKTSPAVKLTPALQKKLDSSKKTSGQLPVVQPPPAALVVAPPPETATARPKASLWADKYKPYATTELVGNSTSITKLKEWLQDWQPTVVERGKKGTGGKNAALLSGPPGIGKTTTAILICKQAGYTPIEYNASDTRSKKLVKEEISTATDNRALSEFFQKGTTQKLNPSSPGNKTVLVMDEVDGMSSGDRGGVAELIALIKKTQVPIICICNDASSPKIRSLFQYCLSLPFKRPTVVQMKPRISHILQLEGVKASDEALNQIIESVHGDFRQLLHVLQMWSLKNKNIQAKDVKERLDAGLKNVELGPFEVIPKLFNALESKNFTLNDKIDFYFVDGNMVPLLVQDNYLHCKPNPPRVKPRTKGEEDLMALESFCQAAEYISMADEMSVAIHKEQEWGLSPAYAVLSTVAPSAIVSGVGPGPVMFPRWLAKFSSQRKRYRLLKEMAVHMSSSSSAESPQVRLDYFRCLIPPLTRPLASTDGIEPVIQFMDSYALTREDWDTVMELTLRPDSIPPIPTAVKTAFTRKYNSAHLAFRKRAANIVLKEGGEDMQELEEALEEGEEPEEEDTQGDKMIKQKTERKKEGDEGSSQKKKGTTRKTSAGGKGKKKQTASDASTESPSDSQSQRGSQKGKKLSQQKPTLDFFTG